MSSVLKVICQFSLWECIDVHVSCNCVYTDGFEYYIHIFFSRYVQWLLVYRLVLSFCCWATSTHKTILFKQGEKKSSYTQPLRFCCSSDVIRWNSKCFHPLAKQTKAQMKPMQNNFLIRARIQSSQMSFTLGKVSKNFSLYFICERWSIRLIALYFKSELIFFFTVI